jgi:FtsH-binding integral membrane protein
MLMSSVFAFFFKVKIPEVVVGGFGALLFSVFLIYDTQRIVGGGATQLDDRDYVLGAMDLYLVGGRRREGEREGGKEWE